MNSDLRTALSFGLDVDGTDAAKAMALSLADAFGPSAIAIIHYGSHARGVDARPDSAYDFFVIVDEYRPAYESLAIKMPIGCSVRTSSVLARILAPNVHAIPPAPNKQRRNKCGVITIRELERAARLEAKDHFVVGRLFQQVQVIWARDDKSRAAVRDALTEIRRRTFDWARAYLPETFDVEGYCRTLLQTSFAGEIRPEGGERADDLLVAQRPLLLSVYAPLLGSLVKSGDLQRAGDKYRQTRTPSPAMRRKWQRHFRISKARATARWSKAILQYDGWLEYLVQKIARHNEVDVELTEREKRWPLIFLWPKVFLFFRERSQWESRQ